MTQKNRFDLAARVGTMIRRLREVQGLSQTDLAAKAGVAQSAVSQIEAGKRLVNLNTLYRLGSALGFPASRLLAVAEVGPDTESLAASVRTALYPPRSARSANAK
jgi:transcriptional regulator with XRE-family HTH domain